MVNPGQHWSCCINNWELLRSLLIAAHSLSLLTVMSTLSFCVCNARSNDKFDSSSELCEDKDEVALIFTSGFICTLVDWFSMISIDLRGDKLSRCCRKCSSVSFKRELNMSDVLLMPTAPIEFDRHSAITRKGNSFLHYIYYSLWEFLASFQYNLSSNRSNAMIWYIPIRDCQKKISPRTSTFFVGEFATDRRATSWKVMGEYILLSSEKNPEDPGGVGDDIFDEPLRLNGASPKVDLSNIPELIRPIVPTEETLFSKLLVCHWWGSCIVIPLVVTERRSRFSNQ